MGTISLLPLKNRNEFRMVEIYGLDLRPFGAGGIGLKYDEAIKLIEFCKKSNKRILGGDTYVIEGENLMNTYENFHSGFSDPIYLTIQIAEKFMEKHKGNSDLLFVIVV